MQIQWLQRVFAQIDAYTDNDLATIDQYMPETILAPYDGEVSLTHDLRALYLFILRRRRKINWIFQKAPEGNLKTERGKFLFARIYYRSGIVERVFWETVFSTFHEIPPLQEMEITRDYRIVWRAPREVQRGPGVIAIYLGAGGGDDDEESDLSNFSNEGMLPN